MRNRRLPRAREADRGGTAAIELVLVLPLLITIVSGAIDLGRIIEGDLKLSNAARVGADYAAAHRYSSDNADAWESRIRESVLLEASNIRNFESDQLTVEVRIVQESEFHTIVTVTASYPLPLTLFWVRPGTQFTVQHSVSVRQIR